MKERFDALVEQLLEAGFFLEEAVELLEKTLIERALAKSQGNQSATSKVLGIHRNTLQRKMVEFQLEGRRTRRKPISRAVGKSRSRAVS
jgi:DNA-binding NtrC family response regulator